MFDADDTIVAVATPPGRGGVGVVRVSGPDAPRVACALIGRDDPLEPRLATFARIVAAGLPAGEGHTTVDQVVVTRYVAPRSYTGDDVVESSGHGSPVLLRRIVEMCLQAGARLAEPGEFTLRAYLNGRVDLVQAEAVADLVEAVTPLQARAAMDQLEGTLTTAIGEVDTALLDVTARLEASLDFPDEGFHFITRADAAAAVQHIQSTLEALAAAGRRGRIVREGRLVVITGPPNAGKSSLFNALAGAARAIVTNLAGTTRDLLTEPVDIHGVPVTLVDTAGLREARDAIEAEGVARAREAQNVAALTLVVLDGAAPLAEETRALVAEAPSPHVVLINKSDLSQQWTPDDLGSAGRNAAPISAATGEGLDAMRALIVESLGATPESRDTPAMSNVRHLRLVEQALAHLGHARRSIDEGATEELVLAELVAARQALEEMTGGRTPDDLLNHIFSRFCVGK
jgi:tRNA modification GTPase